MNSVTTRQLTSLYTQSKYTKVLTSCDSLTLGFLMFCDKGQTSTIQLSNGQTFYV